MEGPVTRETLRAALRQAIAAVRREWHVPAGPYADADEQDVTGEHPDVGEHPDMGEQDEFIVSRATKGRADFSSNVALVLAAKLKKPPGEVAAALRAHLEWPGRIEEAKGFLNFRVDDEFLAGQIARAQQEGEHYGASETLAGTRVNVEFVSADPIGPLPFEFARLAAAGDALCRILAFAGADVTREFYLNDVETTSKLSLLGESVAALYLGSFGHEVEPPEGVLDDSFVRGVARDIAAREGNAYLLVPDAERNAHFAHLARDAAVALQKQVLSSFGVRFDVWTSEQMLRSEGRVDAAVNKLKERGHIYERNGGLWLRTTSLGDETDRPLVRANGHPTYLASDIAYHIFKLERGFDRLINIWTAEHRQYIPRTRAALRAAGCDAGKLEVLPCEGARWLRDGTPVTVDSHGDEWTLDEALRSVDCNTLRFWLLRYDWDSVVDIEAETVRRDDETNPAYAARLLPARLATMIREVEAHVDGNASANDYSAWKDEERELARLVALWPDTAAHAATERKPQLVTQYLEDKAKAVRALLKASRPADSSSATRLALLRGARVTATNALNVLGMKPEDRL